LDNILNDKDQAGSGVAIMNSEEKIVTVYGQKCLVIVSQSSKTVWWATGEFQGREIHVKGRSAKQALSEWIQRVGYQEAE
jgi:hypothetical protein